MSKLIHEVASPKVLNDSWKRLKNDMAMWSEGISKQDMKKDIVYHLTQLADDLKTGKYKPSNVRYATVAKADGRKRTISAFTLRDKVAQRAVLTVIEKYGEKIFHPDSYAYRRGRSVEMAVSKAREYILCDLTWLVDADIFHFFDEIPHGPLKKVIRNVVPDKQIQKLIYGWIDIGAPKTGLIQKRKGIPQGAIISPFLCNIYLSDFDNHLNRLNLPFVRFADDFLVFTPNQKAAEKAFGAVKNKLKKMGLSLNEKKSRIVKSSPKVKFLGRKLPKPIN